MDNNSKMDLAQQPKNNPVTAAASPRMVALDALRGIAVLMMVLSGIIPLDRPIPAWMFHAQKPPPTHVFNPNLPGLTWVDLVFPIFLFCMGAAIPIVLSRKLEQGHTWQSIVGKAALRSALLAWFAIFLQHVRPSTLEKPPSPTVWFVGLVGFLLLFLMFTRMPAQLPKTVRFTLHAIGYILAVVLLFLLRYPENALGFSPERNDIIIMVLADMAFLGTVIWIATRQNLLMRLSVLGVYLGLRLSAKEPGWVQDLWNWSPLPWYFKWNFVKYLFIVLPGTIVGDHIVQWQDQLRDAKEHNPSVHPRWAGFIVLTVVLVTSLLIGLQGRWLWNTALVVFVAASVATLFTWTSVNSTEKMLHKWIRWGSYFLVLGVFFEAYEGGIKKDPSTLSYYFISTGIAFYVLTSLSTLTILYGKTAWLRLFSDVGQNPMVGYCAMENFILPLFALTSLQMRMDMWFPTGWGGVGVALFQTLLLALFVQFLTRRGFVWRA